jgi:hypothetical protein
MWFARRQVDRQTKVRMMEIHAPARSDAGCTASSRLTLS